MKKLSANSFSLEKSKICHYKGSMKVFTSDMGKLFFGKLNEKKQVHVKDFWPSYPPFWTLKNQATVAKCWYQHVMLLFMYFLFLSGPHADISLFWPAAEILKIYRTFEMMLLQDFNRTSSLRDIITRSRHVKWVY